MNALKIRELFAAARKEAPPAPPEHFDRRILAAIRRAPPRESVYLLDQLGLLFPRFAVVAVVIIGLCAATEIGYSLAAGTGLADGVAQLSDQWLFTTKGF